MSYFRVRPTPRLVGTLTLAVLFIFLIGACGLRSGPPAAPVSTPAPAAQYVSADVRYVRRALTPAETADYLGDRACSHCHPKAAQEHGGTRHARTLRRIDPEGDGPLFARANEVKDPEQKLAFRPRKKDGKCVVEVTQGGKTSRGSADYVIGTGRNALSFLTEEEPDRFLKLRISYYTGPKRWDLTPPKTDSTEPLGVIETGDKLDGCLLCHVTVLQRDREGVKLDASLMGVGCERCHGPGRRHVDEVARTRKDPGIERLKEATPARINQLCGDCHRTSLNANTSDPHTVRNVPRFQGLGLELSKCYQKSPNFSCLSCHNPHADAATGVASYEAACRKCHQSSGSSGAVGGLCRVNPRSGCVGCHMPHQQIGGIPHATYRTHWIKIYPKTGSPHGKEGT